MQEIIEYALEWNVSAKYFYDKGYYSWMADRLIKCDTVLEIGCGTGYSTLAMAKKGFRVLAVDKNIYCIKKARELFSDNKELNQQVNFIEGDVVDCRATFYK